MIPLKYRTSTARWIVGLWCLVLNPELSGTQNHRFDGFPRNTASIYRYHWELVTERSISGREILCFRIAVVLAPVIRPEYYHLLIRHRFLAEIRLRSQFFWEEPPGDTELVPPCPSVRDRLPPSVCPSFEDECAQAVL